MLVRLVPLLEDHDLVAERKQVVRDRERRGTGADARDTLAVLLHRDDGQPGLDVVLVVRRDPLQAADGDGLLLDAPTSASGLAGAVAHATEDAREDVRLPVHHVGVGELAQRDQADVFRNVRVRGASPLAVHDPVEIVRVRRIGRLHVRFDPNSGMRDGA
jgi:hypothetical protein